MKRIIVGIILLTSFLSFTHKSNDTSYAYKTRIVSQQSYVLICSSENAYAYHTHYCQGLKRCKRNIYKVIKQVAINKNYSACGYCY